MTFTFTLRGVEHCADTLQAVSEIYSRERDASGEGASTFPSPHVRQNGRLVGRLSYNGRVWNGSDQLIYDNR